MKVITLERTATQTILRWVAEQTVLYVSGTVPEPWLRVWRDWGYTIHPVG
jgi:homospermidine synthase